MERKRYSRRYCRYTEAKIEFADYKDIDLLKHTLSERYKIMPRRLTGNSKKWQERVEVAIKRARHMALIPYIIDHKKVVESPFRQAAQDLLLDFILVCEVYLCTIFFCKILIFLREMLMGRGQTRFIDKHTHKQMGVLNPITTNKVLLSKNITI